MKINSPHDIATLPWAGNFQKDEPLFAAVDDYIRSEPDRLKRQQADIEASIHGMGEACEIDPNYDPLDFLPQPKGRP